MSEYWGVEYWEVDHWEVEQGRWCYNCGAEARRVFCRLASHDTEHMERLVGGWRRLGSLDD